MDSHSLDALVAIARLAVWGCVWLALATFAAAVSLCVLAWWTAHKLRMRELGKGADGRAR